MVQVLPQLQKKSSLMEQAVSGLAQGAPGLIDQILGNKKKAKEDEELSKLAKGVGELIGKDTSQIKDRDILKSLVNKTEMAGPLFEDEEKLRDTFGEKFYSLWKSASVGGKTQLLKYGLEAKTRGIEIDEVLKDVKAPPVPVEQAEEVDEVDQFMAEKPKAEKKPEYPEARLPKNMIPKESVNYMFKLRAENSPLYQDLENKIHALETESIELDVLDSINNTPGALPENFERILINPSTGEPYALAQMLGMVSGDTQRFIKTLNNFTTQAKESYGARVTNFDLTQFLKRLPGLLNTPDGRRVIIEQMKLLNQIDRTFNDELEKVYNHYGLEGISQEEARKIAKEKSKDRVDALKQKVLEIKSQEDEVYDRSGAVKGQTAFDELPSPKSYSGKTIYDEEEGVYYKSDGSKWTRVNNG